MFRCCFLFVTLTILFGPIVSTSTGQIFARFAELVAVDDKSEISFSIPQGTLPWQPIFVGFMHRIEFQ